MEAIFSNRWLSTRSGALLAGFAAAALALVILLVYLSEYRSSVRSSSAPVTVLVAKNLIPKGTSGTLVATRSLFQTSTIAKAQVKDLAVSDPAAIGGKVAVRDIFPGQQLTAADFSATVTDAIPTKLTGVQRAIALPVDSTHGLVGQVSAGDHVDVYVGFNAQQGAVAVPTLKLLAADVQVLSAPSGSDGDEGGKVVVRVTTKQAATFAFAADNGRLWLVLRPQVGAKPTAPDSVTARQLLAGATPIGG